MKCAPTKSSKPSRKFSLRVPRLPTAYTILLFIIAFAVIASWILSWVGVTTVDKNGNTLPIKAAGVLDIFLAPVKGFINRADIIVFILVIGAFIYVSIKTKCMDAISQKIIQKTKGKEVWIIPFLMIFFSILGSTEGFCEESLSIYLIVIPLMMLAGFDKVTGFMIVMFGSAAGVAGSTVNPFLVVVSFNFAGLGHIYGNGLAWRGINWILFTALAIGYTMFYAIRVKKNMKHSVCFATYQKDKDFFLSHMNEEIPLNKVRIASFVVFAFTLLFMIFYLIPWDQIFGMHVFQNFGNKVNAKAPYLTGFIPGIGIGQLYDVATFLFLGTVIIGFINWKGEKDFTIDYIDGVKDILPVTLILALAAGFAYILQVTNMQQLLVTSLKQIIKGFSYTVELLILFLAFFVISFCIPSTSGFAGAVFPIIGPVLGTAKISGAILAFSSANGIVNFFTPTSGVVMGALALSHIKYSDYLKVSWPLLLALFLVAIGSLVAGSFVGNPKIF